MSLKTFGEFLDKKTLSIDKMAKKHKVSVSQIKRALKKGKGVEHEHTSNDKVAFKIASAHVGEDPKYYDKLRKMESR